VKARIYPHERVEEVLTKEELPASHRIVPRRYIGQPLGTTPSDSRFCSKSDGFTVLYAAPDFATAFIEVVVRDRFMRKRQREIVLKEVTEAAWALIATKPRTKLSLLDLRADGCVRLGAPTDALKARSHAAGRALGRAIYADHEDIDGLLFSSRLTGADVYAIFGRGVAKLEIGETGLLPEHPELTNVLSTYEIKLIVA
jgi:hypothetical protein